MRLNSTILVCIVLLCPVLIINNPVEAYGPVLTSGLLEYEVIENGSAIEITKYNGPSFYSPPQYITIPSSIDNLPVISIKDHAFENEMLYSITIPYGVTRIGNYSFFGCIILEHVSLPDTLVNIGDYCFVNCRFSSIVIPGNVTHIGDSAFSTCNNLNSINIPNKITYIGNGTFDGCQGLSSVNISANTTVIGRNAFSHCSLTTLTIPEKVIYIGSEAFAGCGFSSINIPDNVTVIGERAFEWCTKLVEVTIGDKVTDVGIWSFNYCPALITVQFGANVTSIGLGAFQGCKSLTNMTLPNKLSVLGNNAFSGCEALTFIEMPPAVSIIGDYVFGYCFNLTGFDVEPRNKNYSSDGGVIYDSSLTKLVLFPPARGGEFIVPNGIVTIGNGAFLSASLTSVLIPDSVSIIGASAFASCVSLQNVTIGKNVTEIHEAAFEGDVSLNHIVIPDHVVSIENYTFSGCASLSNITLGNSVDLLGYASMSTRAAQTFVRFRGNAPVSIAEFWAIYTNITAFYRPDATGFTTPIWENGSAYPKIFVPDEPLGLIADPASEGAILSWTAPQNNGGGAIDYYLVYLDGTMVNRTAGTSTTISDLTNDASHTFYVVAHNMAGNGTRSSVLIIEPDAPSGSHMDLTIPIVLMLILAMIIVSWFIIKKRCK